MLKYVEFLYYLCLVGKQIENKLQTSSPFIPKYSRVYVLKTRAFSDQNTVIKFRVFNSVVIVLSNAHYLLKFCQLS